MRIPMMLWADNVIGASQFRPTRADSERVNHSRAHDAAMELLPLADVGVA
jgi:hypothetical protein